MNPYKIEAGTAQHIGSRPQQNDRTALFTGARAPGYVMAIVADGMNDSAASEQVLFTAKQLFDEFKATDSTTRERLAELLREIVHEIHVIVKMNGMRAESRTSTTFLGLILAPNGSAVWAHVGDSRMYHFTKRECTTRSSDAAYIEHLVTQDKVPPEAAKFHRTTRLLANTLGTDHKEPFVTVGYSEGLHGGDSFLLCTDGLWQYFTDLELGTVIYKNAPRQAAEMLIKKAAERADGKGDNCSMAIIKLVNPPKEKADYVVQKLRRAV